MRKSNKRLKGRSNITGKIILAFGVACVALFLAWKISRNVFSEILVTVKMISAPDQKLQMVRNLSTRITRLDQLQRTQALRNPNNYSAFLNESKQLRLTLDTLSNLYLSNQQQQSRINEMKRLLKERDKVFIDYVQQRKGLIDNKSLAREVQSVTRILSQSTAHPDSAVTTTEKKVSTTTVYPAETKDDRTFFGKIFGKKKKVASEQKIINEELNISQDTIASTKRDSMLEKAGQAINEIEMRQRLKSRLFASREAILLEAGNVLTGQMLGVLHQVEKEAIDQNLKNNQFASNSVNEGIKRINYIIIGFLGLTVIFLYMIMADIMRNKRYRKELEKAKEEAEYHSAAKQRFLSNMSHEIRTPLQSIIGYSEQLKKANGEGNGGVNAIYHSSVHLLQIVNEVLDYSRIISGKVKFTEKPFNMLALLDEVITVFDLQVKAKSLELFTEYNLPKQVWVIGDSFRLKQILFNLLGNALKFTNKGRITLRVSAKKNGGIMHFNFEVEDTGIGIAENKMKTIFNEFEQENSDGKQTGTGLGLSIIKELIERQQGRIYVSSKQGSWTRFKFYLAFAITSALANDEKSVKSQKIAKPSGKKIWIVDDDRFILDLCSMILNRNKISHNTFQTAQSLLDSDFGPADIIFLDLRMPDMDGFELCSVLRKKLPETTEIYALTAQVMPEEQSAILNAGFNGVLMKPFTESEILHIINLTDKGDIPAVDKSMIDISLVDKMTFGDKDQTVFVLGRFVFDCAKDAEELEKLISLKDHDRVALVVHRIAGRLGQFGARDLASLFREAELRLRTRQSIDEELKSELNQLNEKLQNLTSEVDQYLVAHVAV
ncbi:response regulator [Pedobacter sp. HMF7647]|uniref:histidine kinase n=1 Tax=Hufsiella arboris TaxID=2695275 RepID=A0A7K1YBB0_9SPHI|nr:ATP-binding protein [Hufsiella arboris]MXV51882.1 response regulator [Hufsiella arboris]